MRKALTMLGAIAALALGSLFAAAPAQAAINCSRIDTNPTQTAWPKGDWGMKCVNSSTPTFPTQTNGNNMLNAIPGVGQDELRRAPNGNFTNLNGVRYYLFHTAADYDTWAASNGGVVSHTSADFGVTKVDAKGVPIYSAIWEINGNNETTNIRRAVGTQMGVSLDYLWGYIKSGGIVPTVRFRFSDTIASPANAWQNIYKQNVDRDWALFTGAPCKVGSSFGLFSKFADNRLPVSASTYICTDDTGTAGFGDGTALSSTYASLPACVGVPPTGSAACNKAIVIQAWPELYGDIHGLFAQEYAFMNVANDQASTGRTRDVYLNGRFTCSKMMLRFAGQGKLPVAADLTAAETAAGCILPSMTTKCIKKWIDTGHFPDGNVLDCVLNASGSSVNSVAQNTEYALDDLGRNGLSTSYTSIKQLLDAKQVNIYFFGNGANYTTAFTGAGEYSAPVPSAWNAFTYQNGPGWNIIMNEGSPAGTSGEQFYIAQHELGHVVDFTSVNQQSNLPAFDTAMQNDWLAMDYSFVSSTEATSTRRNPCAVTTGPLVGAINPITGLAFCSGGNFRTGDTFVGNNPATGKPYLTSEVLRDPRIDGQFVGAYPYGPALYQTDTPTIGVPGYLEKIGWREWFAQAFAIQGRADTGSSSNLPELDKIVSNGYFACTAGSSSGWLRQVYLGQTVAPPSQCQSGNLPGWWVPKQ
ncbi:hypothetical protein KF728_18115 [Candidatus Obscuribacterales bacterium]|nr:hypothetical protein [Candidatus Obscuribacterales bacterium]